MAPPLTLRLALLAALAGCAPAPPPAPAAPTPEPAPPPASAPAAPAPAPAGAALYTRAQAEQGQRVFAAACSSCHGLAEFRGMTFQRTWMARPMGDFFLHISTAMPQEAPGSLKPEEYAAVVAYVLQLNGRPAGDRELPADPRALEGLRWP